MGRHKAGSAQGQGAADGGSWAAATAGVAAAVAVVASSAASVVIATIRAMLTRQAAAQGNEPPGRGARVQSMPASRRGAFKMQSTASALASNCFAALGAAAAAMLCTAAAGAALLPEHPLALLDPSCMLHC